MPIDAWWSGDTLSQSDNRFIDSLAVFIVVSLSPLVESKFPSFA